MRHLPANFFVYLASPYAKYAAGHGAAASDVGRIAAALMRAGVATFCPIAMGHAIAKENPLPETHEYWMGLDRPFMHAASMCVVALMPGWQESRGVMEEIETMIRLGKPVRFLPPDFAEKAAPQELLNWLRAGLS